MGYNIEDQDALKNLFGGKKHLNKDCLIPKCLVLPVSLHQIGSEVAFREEMPYRELFERALSMKLGGYDATEAGAKNPQFAVSIPRYNSSLPGERKEVTTTMRLKADTVSRIRAAAHYSHTPEKVIVANSLLEYLLQKCADRYPDLMEELDSQVAK